MRLLQRRIYRTKFDLIWNLDSILKPLQKYNFGSCGVNVSEMYVKFVNRNEIQ